MRPSDRIVCCCICGLPMNLSGHSGETKESSSSGCLGERNGWRGAQSRALPDDDDDDAATKGKVTSGTSQSSQLPPSRWRPPGLHVTTRTVDENARRYASKKEEEEDSLSSQYLTYSTVGCPDPG